MTQQQIRNASHDELVKLVTELEAKLRRKNQEMTKTRERLSNARARIQKLKGIVSYQRGRIIELYT